MKNETWIQTMEKLETIRLFSSLCIRKTRKKALASAQEVDALFRIALKGGITPLELSHKMGASKTIVSRLIDQLILRGFVIRQFDRQDGRSYSLFITQKGKKELDSMCRYYLSPVYKLEQEMDQESLEQLFGLIQRANKILTEKEEEVF